jgi:hypothetical protein
VPATLVSQQTSQKPLFEKTRSHAHELDGFLLRQDRKAFEAALGKPFHQDKIENGGNAFAYHIPGFKQDYLVAFIAGEKEPVFKDKAGRLELTGTVPFGNTGFFGLQLSDASSKVESVLGKPSQVRHEDDGNLDLWDYTDENFSLEFTADHKLYSIQINDEEKGAKQTLEGEDEVYQFAKAIEANDLDELLFFSSGEIECSKREAFGIQGGHARRILGDSTSRVSVCLKEAASAIAALGPKMKGADTNVRVYEKGPPAMVVKFPANSPLREVVLVHEAGFLRVYEVTFR